VPELVEKRIPLTPEEVSVLEALEAATQTAMHHTEGALQLIYVVHGVKGATLKGMQNGELIVLVPEEPT
jgi:hypothetical protein